MISFISYFVMVFLITEHYCSYAMQQFQNPLSLWHQITHDLAKNDIRTVAQNLSLFRILFYQAVACCSEDADPFTITSTGERQIEHAAAAVQKNLSPDQCRTILKEQILVLDDLLKKKVIEPHWLGRFLGTFQFSDTMFIPQHEWKERQLRVLEHYKRDFIQDITHQK